MGRKSLNRVQKHFRVEVGTAERLNAIAIALGYIHGRKEDGTIIPATGELLDALSKIAENLIPSKADK